MKLELIEEQRMPNISEFERKFQGVKVLPKCPHCDKRICMHEPEFPKANVTRLICFETGKEITKEHIEEQTEKAWVEYEDWFIKRHS